MTGRTKIATTYLDLINSLMGHCDLWLWLLYFYNPQKKLPSVIILDEPELGLHPSALSELAGMIRTASRYCQVILATQSPRLLDEFELGEIIVIEQENKTSVFREFTEEQLENWLKDYSLSEL